MTTARQGRAGAPRPPAATLVMVSLPEALGGPSTPTPLPQGIVQITEPLARGCLEPLPALVARSSSGPGPGLLVQARGRASLCSPGRLLGEEPEYLTLSSSHYSLHHSPHSSQGSTHTPKGLRNTLTYRRHCYQHPLALHQHTHSRCEHVLIQPQS